MVCWRERLFSVWIARGESVSWLKVPSIAYASVGSPARRGPIAAAATLARRNSLRSVFIQFDPQESNYEIPADASIMSTVVYIHRFLYCFDTAMSRLFFYLFDSNFKTGSLWRSARPPRSESVRQYAKTYCPTLASGVRGIEPLKLEKRAASFQPTERWVRINCSADCLDLFRTKFNSGRCERRINVRSFARRCVSAAWTKIGVVRLTSILSRY